MNILFTVCGRAGSKGIKNKNMKEFLGYPLVFYTLSSIDLYQKKYADDFYDIVLNTDSEKMIDLILNNVVMPISVVKRNDQLGLDNTPKIAVILDCLLEMEARKTAVYDMVVDLDITAPLRTVTDIKNLIDKKRNGNNDVVFSVTESRRNPYFNMVKRKGNYYTRVISSEYNTRQEAPEIFDMNASLYAYSPDFLKSKNNIFEGNCDIIKMLDTAVLDLDNDHDFEFMQVIGSFLFKQLRAFEEVRFNIDNIINYRRISLGDQL